MYPDPPEALTLLEDRLRCFLESLGVSELEESAEEIEVELEASGFRVLLSGASSVDAFFSRLFFEL